MQRECASALSAAGRASSIPQLGRVRAGQHTHVQRCTPGKIPNQEPALGEFLAKATQPTSPPPHRVLLAKGQLVDGVGEVKALARKRRAAVDGDGWGGAPVGRGEGGGGIREGRSSTLITPDPWVAACVCAACASAPPTPSIPTRLCVTDGTTATSSRSALPGRSQVVNVH